MYIPIFILAVLFWFIFVRKDPLPICGVYQHPGKWYYLKYWLFFGLYKLRQRREQRGGSGPATKSKSIVSGYGIKSKTDVGDMEIPQTLPKDFPQAVDAVYFNASDKNGTFLVAATARRPQGLVQTILVLVLPGVGLLELPNAPFTHLKESRAGAFAAGGLELAVLEPMKKWRLKFSGKMQLDQEISVQVDMDLEWVACTDYFDFDTDMSAEALADAVAREPWSRDFFRRLQTMHQTHYEQCGDLRGWVRLEGSEERRLELRGVRDHSYGNVRDWAHFHRYALQFFHLEDGTFGHIGIISMPDVLMSRLVIGYIFTGSGEKLAAENCDLELHLVGEGEVPVRLFQFKFQAGGKLFCLSGEILARPILFFGEQCEAKIYEQPCKFVCNGKKGWGFAEWDYRKLPELTQTHL